MTTPTPETDAEETQQRAEYESLREVDWPSFPADFDFARKLERERDELKQLLATANDSFAKQLHQLNFVANAQVSEIALDRDAWKAKAEWTCFFYEVKDAHGLVYLMTNCGGHVNGRSDWCPHCGGRIVKEDQQPQPPQP